MINTKQFGPWKVEKPIESGRVYLVTKENDPGRYVLKAGTNGKPTDREVQILKLLRDHPNIITLVDYELEAQNPWHVTEYCSGGTLADLKNWTLEELHPRSINDKMKALAKAFGYAHSQGVLLGGGAEVWLSETKDFIIGDIEYGKMWENHHLDTTDDLQECSRLYLEVTERAKRIRVKKLDAIHKKAEVERCHANAQPSAPARLAAE